MNRMKGLALGFGLPALMAIAIACGSNGTTESEDAGATSVSLAAEDKSTVGSSDASAGDSSPLIPGGTPLASLTYEGAVYYQNPLGTDEKANFNEDDLELVGSTVESNVLSPDGGESLKIYRLKDSETNNVLHLGCRPELPKRGRKYDHD